MFADCSVSEACLPGRFGMSQGLKPLRLAVWSIWTQTNSNWNEGLCPSFFLLKQKGNSTSNFLRIGLQLSRSNVLRGISYVETSQQKEFLVMVTRLPRMFFLLSLVSACFSVNMFASSPAYAGAIEWNTDAAIVAGSGCQKDVDTFVIASGNDVSVVFSNLGFSLTDGSGLVGNNVCNLRIPATIQAGLFISQLDQSMLYGVVKSPGSEGTLRNRARFFGIPLFSPDLNFIRGRKENDPQRVERRKDRFSSRGPGNGRDWVAAWCKRERPLRGAFDAQIKVQGRRDSQQENLIVFVDGLDLRYDVVSQLQGCGG
jgi:hypothetical protein